jgi:hypothetical protein
MDKSTQRQAPQETSPKTVAVMLRDMQNVMEKTKAVRFYAASRMRRESALSNFVLVCGNLVILAISVLALVQPLAVSINAFVVVLSATGLVASAYAWGAKPDLKRHRIYDSAKEMNQVLWQIDAVFTRTSSPTLEDFEPLRAQYKELIGDADENHSTPEHKLVNADLSAKAKIILWIQVNAASMIYLVILACLIVACGYIYIYGV